MFSSSPEDARPPPCASSTLVMSTCLLVYLSTCLSSPITCNLCVAVQVDLVLRKLGLPSLDELLSRLWRRLRRRGNQPAQVTRSDSYSKNTGYLSLFVSGFSRQLVLGCLYLKTCEVRLKLFR